MRRVALGFVASGTVLMASRAVGVMGSWAMIVAVLMIALGALLLAIVMEESDTIAPSQLVSLSPPSSD